MPVVLSVKTGRSGAWPINCTARGESIGGLGDPAPRRSRTSASRRAPVTFNAVPQTIGPPAATIRLMSSPSRRLRRTNSGKPGSPSARHPKAESNFGEASSPDSSRWTIHSSPSPSIARPRSTRSWWRTIAVTSAGVTHRDPPRPRQQGRLDRRGMKSSREQMLWNSDFRPYRGRRRAAPPGDRRCPLGRDHPATRCAGRSGTTPEHGGTRRAPSLPRRPRA